MRVPLQVLPRCNSQLITEQSTFFRSLCGRNQGHLLQQWLKQPQQFTMFGEATQKQKDSQHLERGLESVGMGACVVVGIAHSITDVNDIPSSPYHSPPNF